MPDPTITTIDNADLELRRGEHRDDLLYFSGVDTYVKGTLLGRKLISDTIAAAYTRAGTSTYTVVASCHANVTLELGDYVVTAGTLTTGAGPWTAVSPVTGKSETITTAADTDHLVFTKLGLTLTVTAGGGTTWDTGDVITATAAAQTGTPLVALALAGKGGAQTPMAVMTYEIVVTTSGNVAMRAAFSGVFNFTRLVIDADGDNSNVSKAVMDQLQDQGITVLPAEQLSELDNGAT